MKKLIIFALFLNIIVMLSASQIWVVAEVFSQIG